MKYTQLLPFEKHLTSAKPDQLAALYLVISKDDYERKEAASKCIAALREGRSVETMQGEVVTPEQVVQEIGSMSLFSSDRLIVIHQIEKLRTALQECLKELPEKTVFVLTATTLTSNTKLYQLCEKHGVVVDLSKGLKPWEKEKEMQAWLKEAATKEGKEITEPAIRTLIQQVGTDQSQLFNELQKLACYTAERPKITPEDIFALTSPIPQDTIWKLGEAILTLQPKDTLRIGKGLITGGLQPLGLIPQIRKQIQTDFYIASHLASGGSANDISATFPYMRGRILDQHLRQAKTYGLARFKKALIALDAAELNIKNSGVDPLIQFDKLLLELSR